MEKSQFLADINNERTVKNETYKENLMKLDNLVLVKWADVSSFKDLEIRTDLFFKSSKETLRKKLQEIIYSLTQIVT